jgi:hypothetical protein
LMCKEDDDGDDDELMVTVETDAIDAIDAT